MHDQTTRARSHSPARVRFLRVTTLWAAIALAGCGTLTGAAVGAGSGAAVGAGTGYGAGKGALIGTGIGAAAGAIYDIYKIEKSDSRRQR